MRERAAELERQMRHELERVRRSLRGEIVPYGAYEALGTHPRRAGLRPGPSPGEGAVSIPIERLAAGAATAEQPLGDLAHGVGRVVERRHARR